MRRDPDPLAALSAHPAVVEAVARAREACAQLRWHPALRRRTDQVRTEASVRAAAASAELDGARLPLREVRRLMDTGPGDPLDGPGDPVAAAVRGALRATLDAQDQSRLVTRSPRQVLARLHTLAAGDLLGATGVDRLGRPRPEAAPRVDLLCGLLTGSDAPGLVLAALSDAECSALDAFPPSSGVVGRALARAVVVGSGLDPAGVVVPERHALADRDGRAAALAGYRTGEPEAVVAWVRWWGDAVVAGAVEGQRVADEVVAGRLA